MTNADLTQDLTSSAASTRREVAELWPALVIGFAVVLTVVWCGFLVWVVAHL